MKRNEFDKVAEFINTNFLKIFIIIFILVLTIPGFGILLYYYIPILEEYFRLSDLLSYLGIILAQPITIVVALIAYIQNKQKEEIKRECELINDKINSLPILSLKMEVTEEDYKITIINHSDNPAMDIYIDEYVLGCVDGNKQREFRKKFSEVEWIERECPQKVSLFLRDPRCSCVEMEYVLDGEVYVLKDYNYTSEIMDDYQRS